uniref:Uncharacterized protein n=1 Tax=Oryza meridionalis TaxID=40149 RepID=A0A0E0EQH8_9ORYZ
MWDPPVILLPLFLSLLSLSVSLFLSLTRTARQGGGVAAMRRAPCGVLEGGGTGGGRVTRRRRRRGRAEARRRAERDQGVVKKDGEAGVFVKTSGGEEFHGAKVAGRWSSPSPAWTSPSVVILIPTAAASGSPARPLRRPTSLPPRFLRRRARLAATAAPPPCLALPSPPPFHLASLPPPLRPTSRSPKAAAALPPCLATLRSPKAAAALPPCLAVHGATASGDLAIGLPLRGDQVPCLRLVIGDLAILELPPSATTSPPRSRCFRTEKK